MGFRPAPPEQRDIEQPAPAPIPAAAFLDKDALADISVPVPERVKNPEPTCSTCPFMAQDPLRVNAVKQCRENSPRAFLVMKQNPLNPQQIEPTIVDGYPAANGPCGRHPVLRARAEVAYKQELHRLCEAATA